MCDVVLLRHRRGMAEQRLRIPPVAKLPPGKSRQNNQNNDHHGGDRRLELLPIRHQISDVPREREDEAGLRQVDVAVGVRLKTNLNDADDGQQ